MQVRQECSWKEILTKEMENHKLSKVFQMNLIRPSPPVSHIKHSHNRIENVVEKEHKQSPLERSSIKGMDPHSFEVAAIRHLDKKPCDKFDLFTTSSQSVGWLLSSPQRANEIYMGGGMRTTLPTLNSDGKWAPKRSKSQGSRSGRRRKPHEALTVLNNPKWSRPRGSSDVSKYVEEYVTFQHANPFHKAKVPR
uniref:Uncharacterized protein n=1 Tax=Oxyrrhis marina TaxID=2969 RepID=A0A7S3ULE7_OXYMA